MKALVRIAVVIATGITAIAFAYNLYGYILLSGVDTDADKLYQLVEKQTREINLPNLQGYESRVMSSNPLLDSINVALEPYVRMSGGLISGRIDHSHIHELRNQFTIEELSILSQDGILTRLLPENNLDKVKKYDAVYDTSYSGTFTKDLKGNCLGRAIICSLLLFCWIVVLALSFRGTEHSSYKDDYLFFRYKWANESSLIGRKFCSIIYIIITVACISSTIGLLFTLNIYATPYSSASEDFQVLSGFVALCFGLMAALWAITSIGWWIFGKKQPSL